MNVLVHSVKNFSIVSPLKIFWRVYEVQVDGKLRAQVAETLQYVFRTPSAHMYKKHRLPFYGPSQNCEKRLLASSCLSILLSLRRGQLSFQWGDFRELYIRDFSWNLSRKFMFV
jgi:hypothetical protein